MKRLNTDRSHLKLLFLTMMLFFCVSISFAQPNLPPRTLTVTATQAIHFGTISVSGAGGTVTVGWDGSRISNGDITLLAMAPTSQPAIFEIKLCQGRNVIITFDASTTLTGSNGGSLTLDIGPTEKGINGVSFTTNNDCNFITPLRVGGTLHVPGNTIAGTYTGGFAITFNQE
ncbi:MAG TPA: hypothetical protein DCG69_04485 [Bacteroidales bacterium]|nr:hypothetical protein [Bacteroidales bacterium]